MKPIIPYFSDKLVNPEFREFLVACDKETEINSLLSSDSVLVNKAIKHYEQTNELFNNIMANWSINNIEYWENIREDVLKHPTIEDLSETAFPELYIELPHKSNYYYHRDMQWSLSRKNTCWVAVCLIEYIAGLLGKLSDDFC